jgi:diacylglycerol kinase family enzyme
MRAAAAVLAGRAAALAPFPGGTLNHFARRYGLPTIEDVATALAAGATRRVPVAVLDDEIFLNTATFGYYAEVVRRRERWRRWLSKWPAAVLAMASLLRRNPAIDVELEVDDRRIRRTTALVWIGLGWGSFPRSHQAAERRQAPDLEVAVLRVTSRRELVGFLLRMIPRLVRSERPVNDPALELFHARSVILAGPHALHATMDGERFELSAPVFMAVLDDALLVPVGADAGA